MSAAAASRDVTLFHAHNLLHKHDYNISDALKALVPTTGKKLIQDTAKKTREIKYIVNQFHEKNFEYFFRDIKYIVNQFHEKTFKFFFH